MKHYNEQIQFEVKQLYVEESRSPRQIAGIMKNRPTAATVYRWVKAGNWGEDRRDFHHKKFTRLSDKSIESKILMRVSEILNGDIDTTKTADALAKYLNALEKISSKKKQIPTMFHMLEQFIVYVKNRYPDIINTHFIEAVREFKDHLLKQLTD